MEGGGCWWALREPQLHIRVWWQSPRPAECLPLRAGQWSSLGRRWAESPLACSFQTSPYFQTSLVSFPTSPLKSHAHTMEEVIALFLAPGKISLLTSLYDSKPSLGWFCQCSSGLPGAQIVMQKAATAVQCFTPARLPKNSAILCRTIWIFFCFSLYFLVILTITQTIKCSARFSPFFFFWVEPWSDFLCQDSNSSTVLVRYRMIFFYF